MSVKENKDVSKNYCGDWLLKQFKRPKMVAARNNWGKPGEEMFQMLRFTIFLNGIAPREKR